MRKRWVFPHRWLRSDRVWLPGRRSERAPQAVAFTQGDFSKAIEVQTAVIPQLGNKDMDQADPARDLDYVLHKGYEGRVRSAISNALGFDGHNSILLFRECTG